MACPPGISGLSSAQKEDKHKSEEKKSAETAASPKFRLSQQVSLQKAERMRETEQPINHGHARLTVRTGMRPSCTYTIAYTRLITTVCLLRTVCLLCRRCHALHVRCTLHAQYSLLRARYNCTSHTNPRSLCTPCNLQRADCAMQAFSLHHAQILPQCTTFKMYNALKKVIKKQCMPWKL